MKFLLFMFLIFSSSEVLAKKIVLDCIGSPTLLLQKNEWDNSTDGEKGKVIIDTSKKTIEFNSMLFNEGFTQESKIISARTEETSGMWWHIGVEQNGTMGQTWWLEKTPLMITTYDCKKNTSLW